MQMAAADGQYLNSGRLWGSYKNLFDAVRAQLSRPKRDRAHGRPPVPELRPVSVSDPH